MALVFTCCFYVITCMLHSCCKTAFSRFCMCTIFVYFVYLLTELVNRRGSEMRGLEDTACWTRSYRAPYRAHLKATIQPLFTTEPLVSIPDRGPSALTLIGGDESSDEASPREVINPTPREGRSTSVRETLSCSLQWIPLYFPYHFFAYVG